MLGPEPEGRVTARSSALVATEVGPAEVPGLIDELPLFLLAAARAEGMSRLRGAAELRAKESDRLEVMASILRALGVDVTEYPDGMDVRGRPSGLAWRRGLSLRRPSHGYGGRRSGGRFSEGRGRGRRGLHIRLVPGLHRDVRVPGGHMEAATLTRGPRGGICP